MSFMIASYRVRDEAYLVWNRARRIDSAGDLDGLNSMSEFLDW